MIRTSEMAESPPSGSECRCAPLSLSHELRVDKNRLSTASLPYFSCWFGHPQGDTDIWWRMVLRHQVLPRRGFWALELQLATTAERDGLFHRQPRLHISEPLRGDETRASREQPFRENRADRADLAGSQTNYILRTVDARVMCDGVASSQPVMRNNNNFAVLGYLNTQVPVHICDLDASAVGDDTRRLIVRVTFTVDYHKVVPIVL